MLYKGPASSLSIFYLLTYSRFRFLLCGKMDPSVAVTGPMAVPSVMAAEMVTPSTDMIAKSIAEAFIVSENKNDTAKDLRFPSVQNQATPSGEPTKISDKLASAIATAVVEALTTPVAESLVKMEEADGNAQEPSPPPAKKTKLPHSCEICGLLCANKYNCKRHQRRKHSNGSIEEIMVSEAAEPAEEENHHEICPAAENSSPKLISYNRVYDYGNGVFAMITNMVPMPPPLNPVL
jgi:hypothetical protein